jgi:hypothetical protein
MKTSLVEGAFDLLTVDESLGQRSGAMGACILRDVVATAHSEDRKCGAADFRAQGGVVVHIGGSAQRRKLRDVRHNRLRLAADKRNA